jgi:hypothetical protein
MFDAQDYTAASDYSVAWMVYLAAAAVLLFLQWRFTRRWQRDTRFLLLALVAVLLLMPAPMPGHHVLAPAFGFLLLGGITGGPEVLAPVLVRLSLGCVAAALLVAAEGIWWRARRRRRQAEAEARARRVRARAQVGV